MEVNVISLFDGMSCGRLALEQAGFKVNKYFSSEIDKHAVKVTQTKWTETVCMGSVTDVRYKDGTLYWGDGQSCKTTIDIVLGGSPCQGFSFAGKGLNFEDPRSKLFFEYERIVKEVMAENPNAHFLLENVQMKIEHQQVITERMGIESIVINSALVCAQNRVRHYWTNIASEEGGLFGNLEPTIKQPPDRKIFLKDILQPESEIDEKYYLSTDALKYLERSEMNQRFIQNENDEKSGCLTAGFSKGIPYNVMGVESEFQGLDINKKARTVRSGGKASKSDKHNWDIIKVLDEEKSNYIQTDKSGKGNNSQDERFYHTSSKGRPLGAGHSMNSPKIILKLDKEGNVKSNQDKAACLTGGGNSGGNHSDMDIICVAMRGRNPENPNDRTKGSPTEQRLEPNDAGKTNCLTSVSKDNLLLVPEATNKGFTEIKDGECVDLTFPNSTTPRGRKMEDKSHTLMAGQQDYCHWKNFKLRRLTPIECCRLQTVPDDYFFHEGKQIVSDTQIYKMLGNGWTVSVISYILNHIKK